MKRQYNNAMLNPDSLLEDRIDVVDDNGTIIAKCPCEVAQDWMAGGKFYVVDTGCISFRD